MNINKPINFTINKTQKTHKRNQKKDVDLHLSLKKNKKNNGDDTNDDYEEEHFPDYNSLFKEKNSKIYLKHNHLYFHEDVEQEHVDEVKKLMREYYDKCKLANNNAIYAVVNPKPLYLHIYSNGGDVYAGLSLYDFIIEYDKKIPVHTIVEGVAASAATIISIAGSKRYITPNSYMLIHQISTYFGGNYEQIKDAFGNCDKIMKQIINIYAERTKLNRKQLNEILKRDITWNADKCLECGLVNEIKIMDIFND
jgi:ATP-dependent protease ClpP protease subunit